MTYWLPKVSALADVPPGAVACVHRSLQRLPESLSELLWKHSIGFSVRASFPWDATTVHRGQTWKDCGGYYNEETGFCMLNASWMKGQGDYDSVIFHEIGHALSYRAFGRAHNDPDFRAAWSVGRKRVADTWPDAHAGSFGMGVYTPHWTRGVQEVWAEAVAWMMGARGTIHPAFGGTFRECIEIVRQRLAGVGVTLEVEA